MKNILILCVALTMYAQAMDEDNKVKIASRDVLQQRIEEVELDEYYGKKDLIPMYALAEQEKKPKEVMSVIQSIIQRRDDKIKAFEDANPHSVIHFMKGLEKIHTDNFIEVLLKDYPAVLQNLQRS